VIKFSGTDKRDGRPVLGIGLSRGEWDRLIDGHPILFNTDGMDGLPTMDVCIIAGETERDMAELMIIGGAITSDQIVEDNSLADAHVRPADKDIN
jgi:hypothetical protein